MRKLLSYKYLLGGMLALVVAVVSAPADRTAAEASLLFGQKQAYTAVVRDDTHVVTYGKIYLTNAEAEAMTDTSFTVPDGVKVSNLSVYQITLPERCVDGTDEKKPTGSESVSPFYRTETTCDRLEEQAFGFDEYGYYGYYTQINEDNQLVYKQADLTASGNMYEFDLPEPIKPQERGAYLVSYVATDGYVTGSFGLYDLAFKTLQVPDSIEQVRVAVDVAEDFYTKAKRSDIQSGAEAADLSQGAATKDGGVTNKSLDRLQSNIGSGGVFTKTGRSLAPNETFVVNGQFADMAWKLNLWPIVWTVGGLLVALVVSILLMRKGHATHLTQAKGGNHGK